MRKAENAALEDARKRVKGEVADVGTGFTLLKMRQKPIPKLIDEQKIGPHERDAATEIELAIFTLTSRLMVRGINYERVDYGKSSDAPMPVRQAHAVKRYQEYAKVWSDRAALYADPTLQIVIAAVVDEQPVRSIADDVGYRRQRVERALIWGLRDYAARAGMVSGKLAQDWIDTAEQMFAWRKDIPEDVDPDERDAINAVRRQVVDEV